MMAVIVDLTHEQVGTSIVSKNYSPMRLRYRSENGGREWELDFQLTPEPKITFNGDDPTTDELVECLRYITAPIWFIEICRVAIGHAKAMTPSAEVSGRRSGAAGLPGLAAD